MYREAGDEGRQLQCTVKISARVKRATVRVHMLVQDCAGKSIFSANHILIIAYGQIAPLLASINLVWQVSNDYSRRKFLWAMSDCQSKNAICM